MITRDEVFELLNNAVENGYDLRPMGASWIVADLKECSADCESVPESELRPFVEEWCSTIS